MNSIRQRLDHLERAEVSDHARKVRAAVAELVLNPEARAAVQEYARYMDAANLAGRTITRSDPVYRRLQAKYLRALRAKRQREATC